ncbi:MAG: hypothetical protein QXZ70_03440 [Candidatus Bathyarchaeia archaeon]
MGEIVKNLIFSETARDMAKPTLRKLLENGNKIINALKSDFLIEGQEITFQCPENIQHWEVVFINKKGILNGKKSFQSSAIRKVSVYSVAPLKNVTNECVSFPSSGGFELHYKRLSPDVPYLLTVDSEIENPHFMENIVYKKVLDETPIEGRKRYWMQAQLKFLDVFEKLFTEVRLENLDFAVRVSTHEEIKTVVPAPFKRELELVVKWMSETDHARAHVLTQEHIKLLRSRGGGAVKQKNSIIELIQDLQDIFIPTTFKTFLSIKEDFHYHDALRGVDYYSAPFPTWPKFMTVITRTDLNLTKPAATGHLEFNQRDFCNKIEDIFTKHKIR